jgi:hypothetical protein
MADALGGLFGVMMAVVVVAAIYQLNKKGTPLVPGAVSLGNNTLTSIFK